MYAVSFLVTGSRSTVSTRFICFSQLSLLGDQSLNSADPFRLSFFVDDVVSSLRDWVDFRFLVAGLLGVFVASGSPPIFSWYAANSPLDSLSIIVSGHFL